MLFESSDLNESNRTNVNNFIKFSMKTKLYFCIDLFFKKHYKWSDYKIVIKKKAQVIKLFAVFINRTDLKKKKKSLTSTNLMKLHIAADVTFIKGLFHFCGLLKM